MTDQELWDAAALAAMASMDYAGIPPKDLVEDVAEIADVFMAHRAERMTVLIPDCNDPDGSLVSTSQPRWCPAETAPKDGRVIVVKLRGRDRPVAVSWDGFDQWYSESHRFLRDAIIGWYPIPE